MPTTTVGQTTTTRTQSTRSAERGASNAVYWAIGIAIVAILAIIIARSYAAQNTVAPTTPVESSQTAPVNSGVPTDTGTVDSTTQPVDASGTSAAPGTSAQ